MRGPDNEKPPETVLAGEVSEGFDEASKLPGRLERYAKARGRAVEMLSHIRESGQQSVPDTVRKRLENCGEYLIFRNYYTVGKVRLSAANFCMKHLLCPLCAIRRGAKLLKAYLDRYQVIQEERPDLRPYLITLTVKNGDDLLERYQHLKSSYQKLCARRRDYLNKGRKWTEFSRIQAAVGSYEVTNRGKGWHPHIHILALADSPPDQVQLRREWESITGDSFMCDVRPFSQDQEPAEAFLEVFKYAVKFSDLSLSDNLEAYHVLSGKNLLTSFGLFRKVEVPDDLADEPLDDLPYIELFYRYLKGKGYEYQTSRASGYSGESVANP